VVETGIELKARDVVGEFALLTRKHSRTQTLECTEAGILLQITYGQVEQLFFQNARFGFYFLQLITHRLLQNNERLEMELAHYRSAPMVYRPQRQRAEKSPTLRDEKARAARGRHTLRLEAKTALSCQRGETRGAYPRG